MDLQPDSSAAAPGPLRLSRRKLAIAGGALAAIVAAVVVVVVLVTRSGSPGQDEVATLLKAAIVELAPAKGATGTAARFDTAELQQRLDGNLEGWFVDLGADGGATRVGLAARQLDGTTCVFAWSDVGAPRSAVVTDPALPCVAEVALIAAKSPA
ncbi:MAG: hypothetical protein IT196_02490 [Acidimicrobiales bacterium]|nr:hypothetical protein [Acidimicrobiales bacterium]